MYTSRDKALKACGTNAKCSGVTSDGSAFVLNTGGTPHPAKGSAVYVKSGESSSYGGTQWTVLKGKKLKAYYNKKVYTSKNNALKACLAKAACKGVTREGANKYRLGSTATYITVKGYKTWIQGSKYTIHKQMELFL